MTDTLQTDTPVALLENSATGCVPIITVDEPALPCNPPTQVAKEEVASEETGEKVDVTSDPAIVAVQTPEQIQEEEEEERPLSSMTATPQPSEENPCEKEEEKNLIVVVDDADVSQLDPAQERNGVEEQETVERFSFADDNEDLACKEVMDTTEGEQPNTAAKRKLEVEEESKETKDDENKLPSASSPKRLKIEELLNPCAGKMKAISGEENVQDVRQVAAEE